MTEQQREEAQPQKNEQEETQEVPQEEETNSSEEGKTEEGESVETLKEKLERTANENKELREYKKRAEKRLKQAQQDDAPESEDTAVSEIREELDSMKLQQMNPDLGAEDIEEIKKYAKGAGVSILEAYQNPILKAGIDQSIEQRKNEQASPKDKKRSTSKLNLEPSEVDLDNPEHVQALKDNPELKEEFKKYFGKQIK